MLPFLISEMMRGSPDFLLAVKRQKQPVKQKPISKIPQTQQKMIDGRFNSETAQNPEAEIFSCQF